MLQGESNPYVGTTFRVARPGDAQFIKPELQRDGPSTSIGGKTHRLQTLIYEYSDPMTMAFRGGMGMQISINLRDTCVSFEGPDIPVRVVGKRCVRLQTAGFRPDKAPDFYIRLNRHYALYLAPAAKKLGTGMELVASLLKPPAVGWLLDASKNAMKSFERDLMSKLRANCEMSGDFPVKCVVVDEQSGARTEIDNVTMRGKSRIEYVLTTRLVEFGNRANSRKTVRIDY